VARAGRTQLIRHQVGGLSRARQEEVQVTGRTKFMIGGVVVGLILLFIVPTWIAVLVIAAAIALPVGAYFMLDPSQRRRLRDVQRRRQIGR